MKNRLITFLNKPVKTRWVITILILSWLFLGSFFGALTHNICNAETGSNTIVYTTYRVYSLSPDIQMYATTTAIGYWAVLKAKTSADNIDYTVQFGYSGYRKVSLNYYLYRSILVFPMINFPSNAIIDYCNLTYTIGATFGVNFKYSFYNQTRQHTFTSADQFVASDFNIVYFATRISGYLTGMTLSTTYTTPLTVSNMYFKKNYLLIGYLTDFDKNNTDPVTNKYIGINHGNLAWQQPYLDIKYHLPTFPSTDITINEDLNNCTGTNEHYYNDNTGWVIYNNYTGYSILLSLYDNILNCTGTHQSTYNYATGFKVWANYTGYSLILTILEDLKNCTGTEQYYYNSSTGWKVYNNFTGFSLLLTAIENLINCTGTHTSYYNSVTGWKMYLNYTGNASTGGTITNRTINITINGHGFFSSWNGSVNTNIQNISILMNSDKNITGNFTDNASFYEDKYFLSGTLIFDDFQFSLLILLAMWLFFISKIKDDSIFGVFQLFIGLPLSGLMGTYSYINSLLYGYFVSLSIIIVTLLSFAFVYWKPKNK